MPRPSAAEAIFGHLPHRSDDVAKWTQQQDRTTAEALYPRSQTRSPSNNSDRESLLRHLRIHHRPLSRRNLSSMRSFKDKTAGAMDQRARSPRSKTYRPAYWHDRKLPRANFKPGSTLSADAQERRLTMRRSGTGSGGGYHTKQHVDSRAPKTEPKAYAKRPAGAAGIGSFYGDHTTNRPGSSGFRGEKFDDSPPIGPTNNVAAVGVGGGRDIHKSGSQGMQGRPAPGNPPAQGKDILGSYGPESKRS
jgi:hypothetical protein